MSIQTATVNGLTLAYEEIGDQGGRPLLLVNGLGSQMLGSHDEFCQQLGGRGFHVVRFDNRDVGESSHFSDYGLPDLRVSYGVTPAFLRLRTCSATWRTTPPASWTRWAWRRRM